MRARNVALSLTMRLSLCLLGLAALVVLAGVTAVLLLAPALLLGALLTFGRYPSERVIHRLRGRDIAVRRAAALLMPRAPRSLGFHLSALAVSGCERGPPLAVRLI